MFHGDFFVREIDIGSNLVVWSLTFWSDTQMVQRVSDQGLVAVSKAFSFPTPEQKSRI
jgi:hypothetical protein